MQKQKLLIQPDQKKNVNFDYLHRCNKVHIMMPP